MLLCWRMRKKFWFFLEIQCIIIGNKARVLEGRMGYIFKHIFWSCFYCQIWQSILTQIFITHTRSWIKRRFTREKQRQQNSNVRINWCITFLQVEWKQDYNFLPWKWFFKISSSTSGHLFKLKYFYAKHINCCLFLPWVFSCHLFTHQKSTFLGKSKRLDWDRLNFNVQWLQV